MLCVKERALYRYFGFGFHSSIKLLICTTYYEMDCITTQASDPLPQFQSGIMKVLTNPQGYCIWKQDLSGVN